MEGLPYNEMLIQQLEDEGPSVLSRHLWNMAGSTLFMSSLFYLATKIQEEKITETLLSGNALASAPEVRKLGASICMSGKEGKGQNGIHFLKVWQFDTKGLGICSAGKVQVSKTRANLEAGETQKHTR
ncbi:hypothetical protein CUMW_282050 [Citrus unshiu]|uniref:Uncharacterized protein n=1 Tax=Citrus unshiu TaxID=55188 RepID=A0A2H5N115_CITUN|nr:hypothetical protein CUMW_282050 [Citrus unshiu]